MRHVTKAWHYLLAEPFTWLFYCYFHPAKFTKEIERKVPSERIIPMLRLALPLFVISYPISYPMALLWNFPYHNLTNLLLETTISTVMAVIMGIGWGIAAGMRYGITGATILAFFLSIISPFPWWSWVAVAGGLILGVSGSLRGRIERSDEKRLTSAIWKSIVIGYILIGTAALFDTVPNLANFRRGIAFVSVPLIIESIGSGFLVGVPGGILGGFTISIVDNYLVDFVVGLVGGIAVGNVPIIKDLTPLTIMVSLVCGFVILFIWIWALRFGAKIARGITITHKRIFIISICAGFIPGLLFGYKAEYLAVLGAALILFLFYAFSYYRIPLYLLSALSMRRAYRLSSKNPSKVFTYLHRSSLYWDQETFLSLPRLDRILRIAEKQNVKETLKDVVTP